MGFPIATSLPCIIRRRYERFERAAGDTAWTGARAEDLRARAQRRKTVCSRAAGFAGAKGEGNPCAAGVPLCCGRSGADTMRANREAFYGWRIVPRMLRDVSKRKLSVKILGAHLPAPVLFGPGWRSGNRS
ncbi:MAG: hypothetical protein DMG55_28380 [Acidobacteria bacterium]|nr:MAG: hypothetical protein DMG55_28380 [Acidobacteriota bacterium]